MNLIRSLIGRRQFLFALISSTLTLAFGGASKAFDLIFKTDTAKASERPSNSQKKTLRGIVVYYSATGNTAQVANAIYRGIKSVIHCDVAPIKKIKPADMAKYDLMAIGAPNWYVRVPANVLVFTHEMPRMDGKHAILFGTHGSGGPGMFWILSKNILKKGMSIIGWSDWFGADFMTPGSVPDGEWGHPDSIDLAEAEAFGKEMAEYSIRIHAGERNLIPELPGGDIGEGGNSNLFAPYPCPLEGKEGKINFAGGVSNGTPKFDFTYCVYPRCNRCIENCPVHAIDFSLIAPIGLLTPKTIDASPLVLKEACQQCGGLCERVCTYGAIAYTGPSGVRGFHKVDMTRCTYPKCTACMDNCPQDAIDVSKNPAVIHNWCENESLCYGVCPENAIGTTTTSTHTSEESGTDQGRGPMAGGPGGPGEMGRGQAEMPGGPGGAGGAAPVGGGGGESYTVRFRNLLKDTDYTVGLQDMTVFPRVPIHEQLWPYHIEKG